MRCLQVLLLSNVLNKHSCLDFSLSVSSSSGRQGQVRSPATRAHPWSVNMFLSLTFAQPLPMVVGWFDTTSLGQALFCFQQIIGALEMIVGCQSSIACS